MTDKKLTDNEVVKALECCVESKHICPHTCPMLKNKECLESLRKNALDLINRLQAENERLKERIIEVQRCDKELIETLNKIHEEKEKTFKAEAYKEFAERLKGNYIGITTHYDLKKDIDNLLNELVGEKIDL